MVGWWVTALIRSASWVAEAKLSSAGKYCLAVRGEPAGPYAPEELVWYVGCDNLKTPKEMDILLPPIPCSTRSWRTRWSREVVNRHTYSVFSVWQGSNDVFYLSHVSVIQLWCDVSNLVLTFIMAASLNCVSVCAHQSPGRSGQNGGRRTATRYIASVLSGDSWLLISSVRRGHECGFYARDGISLRILLANRH